MSYSSVTRFWRWFFTIIGVVIGIVLIYKLFPGSDKPRQNVAAESPASTPEPAAIISHYPLDYSIGSCDPRFGISFEKLRVLLKDAASTWEAPAGTALFNYEESAPFKVNLVYDERQQRTDEGKQVNTQLDEHAKSYETLERDYNAATRRQAELQKNHDDTLAIVIEKTNQYNAKVEQWNKSGGAPPSEVPKMNAEKEGLDKLKEQLTQNESALKKTVEDVNTLAAQMNEIVKKRNSAVATFNGKFGESRPFEQGLFNGKEINVYQFEDEAQLKLALIHELGHALGFEHVKDSSAVMFYKTGNQDREHIHLAEQDLELVRRKFGKQ